MGGVSVMGSEGGQDLREVLTQFWLDVMETEAAEFEHRVKVSELLAKYILEAGPTPVKKRGPRRPPTSEVLKMAEEMEGRGA